MSIIGLSKLSTCAFSCKQTVTMYKMSNDNLTTFCKGNGSCEAEKMRMFCSYFLDCSYVPNCNKTGLLSLYLFYLGHRILSVNQHT